MKRCSAEWSGSEKELEIRVEEDRSIQEAEPGQGVRESGREIYRPRQEAYEPGCRERLYLLLESLPHGAADRTEECVLSSVNLAFIKEEEKTCEIELSLRSSYESWYQDEAERLKRLAESLGAEVEIRDEYPAWAYKENSALIKLFTDAYGKLYGRPFRLEHVHAGVECGIIMKNCPSIREAVSVGPTILNAHTTEETLDVESVGKVYRLLDEVLLSYS